jgi:hypothetical protein
VVLGSTAVKAPKSAFAQQALVDLEQICETFGRAAETGGRAAQAHVRTHFTTAAPSPH